MPLPISRSTPSSARVPFGYMPLDRALQPLRPSHVVEREGSLRGKHSQQLTVGFIEATSVAFDVRVEVTQYLLLRDEWRDHTRALIDRFRPVRSVTQARGAGPARLRQPRGNGLQQCCGVFTPRHPRASNPQTIGTI